MDPKIARHYKATKPHPSAFIKDTPEPRPEADHYWLLVLGAILVGAAIVGLAIPFLVFNI